MAKGTVENTNSRVRKWLSREVDPVSITDADLIEICNRLNTTPRKCLGYRTPAEVFRKKLLGDLARAEAFADGMQRTQATVSGIAAATQGHAVALSQAARQGYEQGPSISHYPPVR